MAFPVERGRFFIAEHNRDEGKLIMFFEGNTADIADQFIGRGIQTLLKANGIGAELIMSRYDIGLFSDLKMNEGLGDTPESETV